MKEEEKKLFKIVSESCNKCITFGFILGVSIGVLITILILILIS